MKRHRHPDPHHRTIVTELDDAREATQLSARENSDLCAGCVKCCTYITVEIDAPRAAWEYDQWIWALYHQGVSLYVEKPERWFLHFEARCTRLNAAGRCAIHGRHPVLCREYDPRVCERRLPLADVRAWFDDGDDLEGWLRQQRPSHYRHLLDYRRDTPQAPPVADVAVPSAEVLLTIHEPGARGRSPRRNGAVHAPATRAARKRT